MFSLFSNITQYLVFNLFYGRELLTLLDAEGKILKEYLPDKSVLPKKGVKEYIINEKRAVAL
jgi:hypothetical protein